MSDSVFYKFRKVDENEFFFALNTAIITRFLLIVPQRHIVSYFDLNQRTQTFISFLEKQRNRILKEDPTVTGFNIE